MRRARPERTWDLGRVYHAAGRGGNLAPGRAPPHPAAGRSRAGRLDVGPGGGLPGAVTAPPGRLGHQGPPAPGGPADRLTHSTRGPL
jgi:hypothetical protein